MFRWTVKSFVVRRCSQGPRPPSSWSVPSSGPSRAWPDFRSHPAFCQAPQARCSEPPTAGTQARLWQALCLASGALITTQHAASRHASCASAVSSPSDIFQNVFSIISWVWTFARAAKRHPSCELFLQVSRRVIGTTDFQRQKLTLFSYQWERNRPAFLWNPAVCKPERVCVFLSK